MTTDEFAAASPDSPDAQAFYHPKEDEYAERGVLGSLLCQPDRNQSDLVLTALALFLEPADFCRQANAKVYSQLLLVQKRLSDGPLIEDLFRLPDADTSYLCGLAVEALPVLIVKHGAWYVASLGLQRRIEGMSHRLRSATPAQIAFFNAGVQAKKDKLEAARGNRSAALQVPDFSPLSDRKW